MSLTVGSSHPAASSSATQGPSATESQSSATPARSMSTPQEPPRTAGTQSLVEGSQGRYAAAFYSQVKTEGGSVPNSGPVSAADFYSPASAPGSLASLSPAPAKTPESVDDFADLVAPEGTAPEGSKEGVGSFFEGALAGDFSDNSSWSATAGQTAMGFVPIAGQIADVRDMAAAIKSGSMTNIAIAGVGFIPGLDFLKGGARAGRKAIRESAEHAVKDVTAAGLKRAGKVLSKESAQVAKKRLTTLAAGRTEIIQRLQVLENMPNLSGQTKGLVEKARNAVTDHLQPSDLSGALRDKLGVPVRVSGSGEVFDHLDEVTNATNSLANAERALKRELRHMEPGTDTFRDVSKELEAMAEMRRRVNEFLETK